MKTNSSLLIGIASLCLVAFSAKANVYATNIKLNDTTNNITFTPTNTVQISYILNEPASAGVSIEILSGATVARALTIAGDSPGTTRGSNSVAWDGKNAAGSYVTAGNYSFRITAKATGYAGWTQISSDSDPGNYVYEPTGLAVNKNTNSPFYGRVFVGNSVSGGANTGKLGDQVGILTLNADCSFAGDGFNTGGYPWAGDAFSPWKMEVSADDKLYVNDWTGNGIVLAFDQELTNNLLTVMRGDSGPSSIGGDNNPSGSANMSGPAITGAGTNTHVWMADIKKSTSGGTGITRWGVADDFTCAPNDTGTQIVPLSSDLDVYPYSVFVDKSNYIYTIQFVTSNAIPSARVLRFPPYTGTPLTIANWKIGGNNNDMRGAIGLAVDPTATYVAVSFSVFFPSGGGGAPRSGGVAILRASDGSLVEREVGPRHDTPVVVWDNVGNVYTGDNSDGYWRIYSPPGTNQATTVALENITFNGPPKLTAQSWSANQFHLSLTGLASQSYIIQSSTNLSTWTPVLTNSDATVIRNLILPTSNSKTFYRATLGP